jgi:hypothetical protein
MRPQGNLRLHGLTCSTTHSKAGLGQSDFQAYMVKNTEPAVEKKKNETAQLQKQV